MSEPSHKSKSEMRTLVTEDFRSNHEAIFGEKKPSRGRWIWHPERQEMVPIEEYSPPEPPGRVPVVTDLYMDGTRATDGTDIGTRKKRREYMNVRELADADDFKGVWAKAEKEREAHYRGTADKKARREAIARALHEARSGKR